MITVEHFTALEVIFKTDRFRPGSSCFMHDLAFSTTTLVELVTPLHLLGRLSTLDLGKNGFVIGKSSHPHAGL